MKKKYIFIFTLILITPLISTQVNAQNETSDSIFYELRFFDFETEIKVILEDEDIPTGLLDPGFKAQISAKVQFKYNLPDFFPNFILGTKIGNWIMFRDKNFNEPINLSLSAVDPPKWCEIELPEQVVIKSVGNDFKESDEFFVNLTVNKSVSAFEKADIRIEATFTPESSWGLLTSSGSDNFTIETNYVGKLNATFILPDNSNDLIFEEGKTKTIPLEIHNGYNFETIVYIQLIESSLKNDYFNITLEKNSIVIGAGKNATLNINFSAKKLSESPPLWGHKSRGCSFPMLTLIPKSNNDQEIQGNQLKIRSPDLVIRIEASLYSVLMMALYAIIILIVIVVIILLIRKFFKR